MALSLTAARDAFQPNPTSWWKIANAPERALAVKWLVEEKRHPAQLFGQSRSYWQGVADILGITLPRYSVGRLVKLALRQNMPVKEIVARYECSMSLVYKIRKGER